MMDEYPPLKTTDRYPSKQREFFIVKRKVILAERKGFVKNIDNSSVELKVFPSPCPNFATITGEVGSIVTIKNLLGETIIMITLESENYTLLIENLDCGSYLLSDNLGNGAKLTISR